MSKNFLEIKNLLLKKWFTVFVLISLLFFQLIYSFLFPVAGSGESWIPFNVYLLESSTKVGGNGFLTEKIYPLISPEYRLNCDVGGYLKTARDFGSEGLQGTFALSRPLYPFLIFLGSLPFRFLGISSPDIIFALSILVNFILIGLAVLLFFKLLKDLFSLKIAFLSSILLIFSPYTHNSLIQPLAEMLMIFAVVLFAYLLYNYVKKPSMFKLVSYSLIIGILMLGKMFFVITVFVLLLAIYFKRYKEGAIFLIAHLIPLSLWYLWVTRVWQIPYIFYDVQYYWAREKSILDVFNLPLYETGRILLHAIPYFITALSYGFLFLPIIFSLIGWQRLPFKSKNLIYFGSIISLFFLGFMTDNYAYRHAFLLFPIIYPTAILGIDRIANFLGKHRALYSPLFYSLSIGLMIFISNVNFYQFFPPNFDYLNIVHWSVWPAPDFLENIFKTLR